MKLYFHNDHQSTLRYLKGEILHINEYCFTAYALDASKFDCSEVHYDFLKMVGTLLKNDRCFSLGQFKLMLPEAYTESKEDNCAYMIPGKIDKHMMSETEESSLTEFYA